MVTLYREFIKHYHITYYLTKCHSLAKRCNDLFPSLVERFWMISSLGAVRVDFRSQALVDFPCKVF